MPLLKRLPVAVLLGCSTSLLAYGQALPTQTAPTPYTGFSLPTIGGSLRYSLTASETFVSGYNGISGRGTSAYTTVSGNLAYLSRSEHHPFSAVYSGGYLIGNSQYPSYPFQALSVSQVLQTRDWTLVGSDSLDYSPQTPATGLSGIPGTGDVGLEPVQVGPQTGLGILTTYATRVTNTVTGTATRNITGSTSVSATGAYLIQRYTGNSSSGIDNNTVSGVGTVRRRLDARTSLAGSYAYTTSSFQYPLLGRNRESYQTHSVVATYTRQLTHTLALTASAGPQWVVPGQGGIITHSSLSAVANASVNYTGKQYNLALAYARSVNNGNGVVVGSRYDLVSFTAQRTFARIFQASGLVGYNRSKTLENSLLANYNSSGVVASGQVSAQVKQPLSVFASYTLQRQLFDGVAPAGIAFNGLSNYISFGVTYSPRAFFDRK